MNIAGRGKAGRMQMVSDALMEQIGEDVQDLVNTGDLRERNPEFGVGL